MVCKHFSLVDTYKMYRHTYFAFRSVSIEIVFLAIFPLFDKLHSGSILCPLIICDFALVTLCIMGFKIVSFRDYDFGQIIVLEFFSRKLFQRPCIPFTLSHVRKKCLFGCLNCAISYGNTFYFFFVMKEAFIYVDGSM